MKDFIKWCVSHWQFISTAALSLVSLLVLIFKPRTKSNLWSEVLYKVIAFVPAAIYEAETQVTSGEDKKRLAMDSCFRYARRLLHRLLTDDECVELKEKVGSQIESVLYCPTKKGGIGREA